MITVEELSKRYGDLLAIDDASFECKPGRVTGFLGPNGAGKSTTMRIMAGLTPPTAGSATIEGARYRDIPNPATKIGVLLDASAQHDGRTGRETLLLGAKAMGLPPRRVDDLLALVKLNPTEARRRVGDYSLGMRQRLGVAHALLGDPKVLILDEPANGLDPAGINWMRELLREHAQRGGTVLLSSHLLHEVEAIADELIVIAKGRIVAQGTKQELLRTSGTFVRAIEPDAIAEAMRRAGIEFDAADEEGFRTDAEPELIGRTAAESHVALLELRPAESTGLEDVFLQLTSGQDASTGPPAGHEGHERTP